MYFGSVRFFKHVILTTVALMIVIPLTLSIVFGVRLHGSKKQVKSLQEKNQDLLDLYDEQSGQLERMDDLAQLVLPKNPETGKPDYSIAYQSLYPELRAEKTDKLPYATDKVVYLTFDDGPSKLTEQFLDVLKENGVKATFFVTPDTSDYCTQVLRRMADEGHTIGIRSFDRDYKRVYASVDDYLADFSQAYDIIRNATGISCSLFRFPGGSINAYNSGIYMELIGEMLRRGFTYHDWNASSGDAGTDADAESVTATTVESVAKHNCAVVLLHDGAGKTHTLEALPELIAALKEQGYEFRALTPEVKPFIFGYIE